MLKRFLQIYDLQKQGIAFETPQALLQHVDLYEATQQTLQSFMEVSTHIDYTRPRPQWPAVAHAADLLQHADLSDSKQTLQSFIAVSRRVGQTHAWLQKPTIVCPHAAKSA